MILNISLLSDIIIDMELFKIVKDNKKSLREKSINVEMPLTSEMVTLLNDMVEYLKCSQDPDWSEKNNVRPGVGLSAPQIGINKNFLAIYYVDEKQKVHQYAFVNPKIISESVRRCALEGGEGCLSVDKEHKGLVHRAYKVTFEAYNILTNKNEKHTFTGYEAIVFQHEYDHLKGILFYDHIDKKDPFKKVPDAVYF